SSSDRALIVLDMTVEQVSAVPAARDLLRFIRGELRYFRERGRPIYFAASRGVDRPTPLPELLPRAGEKMLWKPAPSAFFRTNLDELLPRDVRRLTLVGLETHTSVLLTAADAYARGYQVVAPEPCVVARDPSDHAFAMRLLRDVWQPALRDMDNSSTAPLQGGSPLAV
ncbi:MAG: cysteine hydrolase family protein, partial [Myxococcota bacterium]